MLSMGDVDCEAAGPAALDEIAIKLDTVVEGRTKLEVLDTVALDEAAILLDAFNEDTAALEAKKVKHSQLPMKKNRRGCLFN